jgi:hypothetical protein
MARMLSSLEQLGEWEFSAFIRSLQFLPLSPQVRNIKELSFSIFISVSRDYMSSSRGKSLYKEVGVTQIHCAISPHCLILHAIFKALHN